MCIRDRTIDDRFQHVDGIIPGSASATRRYVTTVSYTHLDVYKRQKLTQVEPPAAALHCIAGIGNMADAADIVRMKNVAVSYTHLHHPFRSKRHHLGQQDQLPAGTLRGRPSVWLRIPQGL